MIHFSRVLNLLGRHVMRCSDDIPSSRERSLFRIDPDNFRDAEIGDLDPALLVQQKILRFDIPVDDALVMSELERFADLRDDLERLFRR